MLLYLITGMCFLRSPVGLALAFIALVPLLQARNSPNRRAALGSLFPCGLLCPRMLAASTTVLGWAALALYCAAYVAVFALLARFTPNVLALAAGWILLEFVRGAIAFTGFPWLLLSHSQYAFTPFTQILDVISLWAQRGSLVIFCGGVSAKAEKSACRREDLSRNTRLRLRAHPHD
jgi:apolipoprotein N-acyltransferase